MRFAATIAVNKDGKSKLIAGPEVDVNKQRHGFADLEVPDGGSVILFVSDGPKAKVRRSIVPPVESKQTEHSGAGKK